MMMESSSEDLAERSSGSQAPVNTSDEVDIVVSDVLNGCPEEVIAAARHAVLQVLRTEGRSGSVCIYLTDDGEIAHLNGVYRGKKGPTDVLSFSQESQEASGPSINEPEVGERILGDVVISLETAQRQAATRGHTLECEVAELAAHGTLHLLGYEDESEDGAAEMARRVALSLSPASSE